MDGWEATRHIRNWEIENCDICRQSNVTWCRHNRLPIVAVTADAMKGTHEECFSAGMDDYITKVSAAILNPEVTINLHLSELKQVIDKEVITFTFFLKIKVCFLIDYQIPK